MRHRLLYKIVKTTSQSVLALVLDCQLNLARLSHDTSQNGGTNVANTVCNAPLIAANLPIMAEKLVLHEGDPVTILPPSPHRSAYRRCSEEEDDAPRRHHAQRDRPRGRGE